ncbi:TonB-dependent receptor [Paraburkholderia bannensis]|uniref:TonB-dependent receptor n=1 Tax=Paraburkholderia bannensis TaxID=765414 RepID=UPI002AB60255|nr:TonB-dependent receptor [Paraburkholderia bannensis]
MAFAEYTMPVIRTTQSLFQPSPFLVASLVLFSTASAAQAQSALTSQTAPDTQLPAVTISATADKSAATPVYSAGAATLGPLGSRPIADTPFSITTIPEDLLINTGARTVNDALRYLPSVEIRDQQGYEVSRPQSRGFQGSIVQNTRLDGMNIIGTTAIPTENLSGIEVLNGLAGSLYGPQPAAGVFNYILKRPTDTPLYRFVEGFDSRGVLTEQGDLGGRVGPNGVLGYRLNVVHGEGASYTPGSQVNRTLVSGDFDFHVDARTIVELDLSHYETDVTGLPGSIVYGSGKSTVLPAAVDPTRAGYSQPGAGTNLVTNTAAIKFKHRINDDWSMEAGGLYQNAERGLYGITNSMTDNAGNFKVTKNFTAVPHFTIASYMASLNGHFKTFSMENDLSLGINGFENGQYSNRNSIATVLGTSSLANPVIFPSTPLPATGGQYQSASISEQSFVAADTLHFNSQWALHGALAASFLNASSFNANGATTSRDSHGPMLSPTVALTYKPAQTVTTYVTWSDSVEEGDQAPAGTANVNQFMAPYHDHEYEAGVKYAPSDALLVTLDGFRMTRPLAETSAATNLFSVVGTQRNIGAELFVQGDVLPSLSVLGGLTYVDARLTGTGNAATSDMRVVGVPRFKGDLVLDYHPHYAEGLALTGAVHYESDRAATNTNNSFASAYATFDLGVRYSTARFFRHHATARLDVLNVTNRAYYVSIADGNIVGSAGANTAYLGTPRTVRASLELDF